MTAWQPNDSAKFNSLYYTGATDYELTSHFSGSSPDKISKHISRQVQAGMLVRRGLFAKVWEQQVKTPDNAGDRELPVEMVVDLASLPKPFTTGDPANILVIGDTHLPFCLDGYLEFCRAQQERFNCGTVVHIGDEVDNCAMSYHELNPDGHGAGREADLAQRELYKWYHVFPEVKVIIGNHSSMHFRKAFTSGIPKRFLKDYSSVWDAPSTWTWHMELEMYGVYFVHGTGSAGDRAAYNKALTRRQSVVQGHIHTIASVQHSSSPSDCIYGMQVGCGVDDESYAMAYAKVNAKPSILSCGVILDAGKTPFIVTM